MAEDITYTISLRAGECVIAFDKLRLSVRKMQAAFEHITDLERQEIMLWRQVASGAG